MIFVLAAALSVAAQPAPAARPDPSILKDAAQAIDAGRLQEAKLIIARAITVGFRGAPIERLTADLAFASGKYLQAMAGYQRLVASPAKQPGDCEKGALSALEIDRYDDAKPLVACAIATGNASWRVWNARGVFADSQHDWALADEFLPKGPQAGPERSARDQQPRMVDASAGRLGGGRSVVPEGRHIGQRFRSGSPTTSSSRKPHSPPTFRDAGQERQTRIGPRGSTTPVLRPSFSVTSSAQLQLLRGPSTRAPSGTIVPRTI